VGRSSSGKRKSFIDSIAGKKRKAEAEDSARCPCGCEKPSSNSQMQKDYDPHRRGEVRPERRKTGGAFGCKAKEALPEFLFGRRKDPSLARPLYGEEAGISKDGDPRSVGVLPKKRKGPGITL